jgi:hypothetical protein
LSLNTLREVICSQVSHCLSCPIQKSITGKDCRELSDKEIKEYVGEEKEKWDIK